MCLVRSFALPIEWKWFVSITSESITTFCFGCRHLVTPTAQPQGIVQVISDLWPSLLPEALNAALPSEQECLLHLWLSVTLPAWSCSSYILISDTFLKLSHPLTLFLYGCSQWSFVYVFLDIQLWEQSVSQRLHCFAPLYPMDEYHKSGCRAGEDVALGDGEDGRQTVWEEKAWNQQKLRAYWKFTNGSFFLQF